MVRMAYLFLALECIQYSQLFYQSVLIFYIFHQFKNSKALFYCTYVKYIIFAHGYLDNEGSTVLSSGS